MKRVLIKIAKALAVLALLVVVTGGVLTVIGGRRYEAELQKLKAKGEPYTLVELAGPMPPDRDNGSVIYREIFKRVRPLNKPGGVTNQVREGNKAAKLFDKLTSQQPRSTTRDWDDARGVVSKLGWLPAMVEEAAARPKCKFPVRWQDGSAVLMPQLWGMRAISRIMMTTACVEAHDGKADSAVRVAQLALQCSRAVENEPCLISFLVHMAQVTSVTKGLRTVAAEANLTNSQAKTIYDSLSEVDFRPHWILSVKGERGFGLLWFSQIRRGELRAADCLELEGGNGATDGSRWLMPIAAAVWRPLLCFDSAAYLRFMQKQVDLAGVHYRDLKPGLSEEMLEAVPKYCFLTRGLVPVYVPKSVDRAYSELALGQAAMTLIAYKDKFGSYPASLAEASSKVGWKIPLDPFSGKSLVYKRRGKGFMVYSIGANLKDDGGSPPPKGKNWDEAGDIVWSMDH